MDFKRKLMENSNYDLSDITLLLKLADPHWQKLTEEEKEAYKEKAGTSDNNNNRMMMLPIKMSRKKRNRLNCLGLEVGEDQKKQESEMESYKKMVAEIKQMVTEASELGGERTVA